MFFAKSVGKTLLSVPSSNVVSCSLTAGPPGNPEIWWASISEGSVEGGDELGLIGKKFQSGKRCCCVKLKDDTFLAQD